MSPHSALAFYDDALYKSTFYLLTYLLCGYLGFAHSIVWHSKHTQTHTLIRQAFPDE